MAIYNFVIRIHIGLAQKVQICDYRGLPNRTHKAFPIIFKRLLRGFADCADNRIENS